MTTIPSTQQGNNAHLDFQSMILPLFLCYLYVQCSGGFCLLLSVNTNFIYNCFSYYSPLELEAYCYLNGNVLAEGHMLLPRLFMTIRLVLVMIYPIFTWMWGLLQKVESNFISTNLLLVFVFLICLVTVFIMLKLGRVLSSECGKHG